MYETFSYCSEILVFLYIGLGTFAMDHAYAKMGGMLLLVGFIAIFVGRFLNIYGLSITIDIFSKKAPIPCKYMVFFIIMLNFY